MKNLASIILAVLCFGIETAKAQDQPDRCHTFERHQVSMEDPDFAAAHAEKMDNISHYLHEHNDVAKADCAEILFLPVAVHFQNVGIDLACARDMAVSQVERLNMDFAGTNADITKWTGNQATTWPGIQHKESCIQFCLATLNHPAGQGIAEGDYAVTLNQFGEVDNIPEWAGYLNMFVRDMGNPLGFSPLGGNANGDGVTIGITYFGEISCGGNTISATYSMGRTATHEVGHYLSLSHPFDSGDCVADGDNIADTPFTNAATYGCYADGEVLTTCTDPILWPSYMDYVDDPCMYMFSTGQVDNMEAHVNANLQNLMNNATTTCEDAACIDFEVNIATQDETCAGIDGEIIIQVTDGTDPIQYSLDNGITFEAGGNLTSQTEGDYEVYVIDDAGCEYSESITLERETPPIEVLSALPAFCGDNTGSLKVKVNHSDDFEFKLEGTTGWQDTSYFGGLTSGVYNVLVRNSANCTSSLEVEVEDDNNLSLVVSSVKDVNCPLFDNGLISLNIVGAEPPVIWRLNNGPPTDIAYFDNLSTGEYFVSVADNKGCKDEYLFELGISYTNIDESCPCDVFIPNAMTPDGDGLNDLLQIIPTCPISDYRLEIYNRWGELIFETQDQSRKWNGGDDDYYHESGIYYYRMYYRWGETYNESLEVQMETGNIHVLRQKKFNITTRGIFQNLFQKIFLRTTF